MSDKTTITISLERNPNGTVTRKASVDGEGFHYFELIGLLQMICYDFERQSTQIAKELPKDKKVRIKFKSDE